MICSGAALSNRASQSRERHVARPDGLLPGRGACFDDSPWECAGGGVGADAPDASSAGAAAWAIGACERPGNSVIRTGWTHDALHNQCATCSACGDLHCCSAREHEPGLHLAGAAPKGEGSAWPPPPGPGPVVIVKAALIREAHPSSELHSDSRALLSSRRCAATLPLRCRATGLGQSHVQEHGEHSARCFASAPSSVRPRTRMARAWLVSRICRVSSDMPLLRAAPASGGELGHISFQMTGHPLPS